MQSEGTTSAPTPTASSAHHGPLHRNTRREARELALRMLFQIDVGGQEIDEVLESSLEQSVLEGANREFAEKMVRGTWSHLDQVDTQLRELSVDWALERQAAVDRNILRMTTYEILYNPDTPIAAIINEAVELAKKYSTAESGKFVNGVLGGVARSVQPNGHFEHTVEDVQEDISQTQEGMEI